MWLKLIKQDVNKIEDCIKHFTQLYEMAKSDCKLTGKIESLLSKLPELTEQRFNELQELEAILEYLNIILCKIKTEKFRTYLEKYNKQLSSRDAERYADGDDDVIQYKQFVNEIAYIRNCYLGIIKGLETSNYMISNMVRLRVAGLEEAIVTGQKMELNSAKAVKCKA